MLDSLIGQDEVLEAVVRKTYDKDFGKVMDYLVSQRAKLEKQALTQTGEAMYRSQGAALLLIELENMVASSRELMEKAKKLRETRGKL